MKIAFGRAAIVPLALLLAGATPGDKFIRLDASGEGLVVPANSPVGFRGWGKDDVGHFSGRFVLTGTYSYGCEFCDDWPIREEELSLKIMPDPALQVRLPHWKVRSGPTAIFVIGSERLNRTIGRPAERRALKAGKLDDIHGRITIIVDRFDAGIECDGPTYSAHLVAVVKRPTVQRRMLDSSYGCGG